MGEKLREYLWRNRRLFTQKEFAKRIMIDHTYLSKIACGLRIPSEELAIHIQIASDNQVDAQELIAFCRECAESKNNENK